MRVLLIKTSSMGDLIHTLPALTDAGIALPGIAFDWVVEEAFGEIPAWHRRVDRVIPISLRRWRKGVLSKNTSVGLRQLHKTLNERSYDLILDAQGLVKSAFLTFFTKGVRAGLNWNSARERLASLAYQRKCKVNFYQHAIPRMRQLFSLALDYPLSSTAPDFGLQDLVRVAPQDYVVFLHGTTWRSKEWPEAYWVALAKLANAAGFGIKLSGGNGEEVARARRIANAVKCVQVFPYLSISAMAQMLGQARAAVAVDTGFGHLAAALGVPVISIYGATNSIYTGVWGELSTHLTADFPCAPCLSRTCGYKKSSAQKPACYESIPPARVWQSILALINKK